MGQVFQSQSDLELKTLRPPEEPHPQPTHVWKVYIMENEP